jgi:hypothetical protein
MTGHQRAEQRLHYAAGPVPYGLRGRVLSRTQTENPSPGGGTIGSPRTREQSRFTDEMPAVVSDAER